MAIHWTEAWPEIAERLAAPPRLLVACDFDGTLTPLVADPDKAQLSSAVRDVLRRLQSAPGVSVAVVSGRSLADIARRVPLEDVIFAGNHGLENRGLGMDGERSQAAALKPRLQVLAQHLGAVLGDVPGILIENKGLSVAVHFRNVGKASHKAVIREVSRIGATDGAFRIQPGHLVAELIPDIGWSKGAALKQIIGRMGLPGSAVFYAGDDTTDESVFLALPTAVTVSVGPDWISAARWMAREPGDICRLLERIVTARSAWTGAGRQPSL
jgi:trehalose-phosphatase